MSINYNNDLQKTMKGFAIPIILRTFVMKIEKYGEKEARRCEADCIP